MWDMRSKNMTRVESTGISMTETSYPSVSLRSMMEDERNMELPDAISDCINRELLRATNSTTISTK